jgi:acyl-coenzyme A synthetase/AMP-(fatty) acid ligase
MAITSSKNDLALWTEGTVKPATGFTPLKISPNSTSIIELFEKQVDRTPHRAALKAQKTVVSYASLNRQANRVAHALLGDRKSTHPLVPLVMGHAPEKVIAAIGVLKAGLGYVTIDETAIDRVIQDLLNHTGAPLVITDVENFDRLRLLSDPRLKITLIDDLLQVGSEENPNVETSPETIADVGYTSGSTGTPKGVVRTMAHEVHRVQSIYNTLKVGPEDTVAFLQNFWFTSLFLPLICGATASVFDLRNKKLSTMKRWLREARVSVYAGMVTGFSQLLKALNTNEFFSDMRVITLIGEPVHSTSLEKFRTAFPENCTLVSCYGSNEQAMIAKFVVGSESCPQQGGAVPVGFTDDETEVELIDRDFQVAPEGEIGEFAVTSPFPSSGYWQEPELTAKTWVRRGDNGPRIYLTGDLGRRDASGCLHVVGRKDDQIKIRGYRFLCSEVDAVLNGLPGIRQAAVAPFGGDVTDEKLACYYVSQSGEPLDVSELRTSLAEVLPSYMIPNAFLLHDTECVSVDR